MNRALNAHKLGNGIGNYSDDMMRNTDGKADFFVGEIQSIIETSGKKLKILDVGCCSGELTSKIKKKFGDLIEIEGVDLSKRMVRLARKRHPDISFETNNGYSLSGVPKGSQDIILYSSLLHELGSYFSTKRSRENYNTGIATGLSAATNCLVEGGHILIKDPVMPQQEDDLVSIRLYPHNNPPVTKKKKSSKPNDMSLNALIAHFIKKFPWIDEKPIILDREIECPRKLVTEIARHTSSAIGNTWCHFNDELQEWYGSWHKNSWEKFSSRVKGILIKKHQVLFSEGNHSATFYDNVSILDNSGALINARDAFPTHQYTVIQKI